MIHEDDREQTMTPNIKEILVKIAPWVTLVLLIMTLPLVLLALGLGALVAPFAFLLGPGYGFSYLASARLQSFGLSRA